MLKSNIKIYFQTTAIFLVLGVLSPSLVKLAHAFNHHQHEVCENQDLNSTHFHKTDIDCEFYKFKITKNVFFSSPENEPIVKTYLQKLEDSYYQFFIPHQQLTSFLRGPPRLV